MPEYIKNFSGKMAIDNDPYRVSDADYIDAWNITRDSVGAGQDHVVSNIIGNRISSYSLPSGVNKCIGTKEDLLRNRIYFFVWNDAENHSILYYDRVTDVVYKLLESKTDSGGVDILLFNPNFRINHVDIIYRDEGDLIFFVDGQDGNVFSLDFTFVSNLVTLGTPIKRQYIQAAKQTSQIPPFCCYEDDVTVTVNNLRKSLFKFKVRYVYNDFCKSITSSQSTLPLPVNQDLANDPASKNSKISIAILTGEKNVVKVEVLACNTIANTYSDYYLIESIDKAALGLADNDVYVFAFYNNKAYANIDVKESIQLQDYVPQSTFTQVAANGNTIEYANYVEGYDLQNVWDNGDGSANSSIIDYLSVGIQNTKEFGNIKAYQGGNSGYGSTGNNEGITIVAFGNFKISTTAFFVTDNGNFSYTNSVENTAAQFIAGVQAAAVTAGFTVISSTGYNNQVLVIRKNATNLLSYNFDAVISTLNSTTYKGTMPVYDWWSRYQFGLVYFDEKDRTNGVVYPVLSTIQTGGYQIISGLEQMQQVLATIWNKPPIWASYYHIVRTKDLAKGFFVQWISDYTLKETGSSVVENSYAYIGINPLLYFIAENPSSSYLGYSFVAKDRIRLIKKYQILPFVVNYSTTFNPLGSSPDLMVITMTLAQSQELGLSIGDTITISGTVSNNVTFTIQSLSNATSGGIEYYLITATTSVFTNESIASFSFINTSGNKYTDKDFEILELAVNPTVNGIDYVGSYVKIILPTTSATFDFGTDNFNNYFFELYRPTVPAQGNLNVYYEFGERYMIANAGTILALHQGEQNQTVNGSGVVQTAASITMFEGDYYGRYRDINISPVLKWKFTAQNFVVNFGFGSKKSILGLQKTTIENKLLWSEQNDETQETIDYFTNPSGSNYFLKILDGLAHNLDINVYLPLSVTSPTALHLYYIDLVVLDTSSNVIASATSPLYSGIGKDVIINHKFSINCPATSEKLVLLFRPENSPFLLNILDVVVKEGGLVSIVDKYYIFKQFCIDPNFSDYFQSAVNSNGRALTYDENAKQQRFGSSIRFSNEFQQNTNINRTNRFYYENVDDYDRGSGDIMKLFVEGRRMYVLQQFDIGVVPVLQQIVKTASGDSLLTQNDTLLNKIQYPYQNKLGIGNVPESFAFHENSIYGIDNNKGVAWRLSQNGQNELSVIYECDSYFKYQCLPYATTLNNGNPQGGQPYLGNPTIYGGFDRYTNKVIWCFEEINRYNIDGILIYHKDPSTIIFNETRDTTEGFECFASFYPENIESLGTLIATFKNGQIWTHDASGYNTFYGTTFDSSITAVFNNNAYEKKTYQTLSQLASAVWDCPVISTQTKSYGTTNQQSSLIAQDFTELEGTFEACFLRDANSIGGLLAGDGLYGHYIIIKFRKQNATNYIFLNMVAIKTLNSPLSTK